VLDIANPLSWLTPWIYDEPLTPDSFYKAWVCANNCIPAHVLKFQADSRESGDKSLKFIVIWLGGQLQGEPTLQF